MDTTYEMSKLVAFSSKRDSLFEKLTQELAPETPGFRTLCPTRWTVRANSLQSVLDNYVVLQDLWEESYWDVKDTDIRARIKGVDAQMKTFDYLFGVMLGQSILRHTDNLSKGLQHEDLSACEGQTMAQLTLETLSKLRTDERFAEFYNDVKAKAESVDVNEPSMPRRRKMPKRFQIGDAEHFFPQTERDMYRQNYFEAMDLMINCVKNRFDQPGYKIFRNVEELLVKSVRSDFEDYSEEFTFVTEFCAKDINKDSLKVQLETLKTYFDQKEWSSQTVRYIWLSAWTEISNASNIFKNRDWQGYCWWFQRQMQPVKGHFQHCAEWKRTWEVQWPRPDWIVLLPYMYTKTKQTPWNWKLSQTSLLRGTNGEDVCLGCLKLTIQLVI